MNKFTLSLMTILFVLSGLMNIVLAQAPEGIIYQAEARDSKGKVLSNSNLDVKIGILKGSFDGISVYEEFHNITTSNNGMFVLVIGDGTNPAGVFEDVDWGNHFHFLNVQVKKTKNNVWTDMGTTQLLSVPYALHAKTAETVIADETDPVYSVAPAASITVTDITNLGNLSGINTGDQNISGIAVNAGAITTLQSEQTTQNTAIGTKVTANSAITAGTNTKITYDSKGLVTGSASATTTDIAEGTNLYYTDARVSANTDVAANKTKLAGIADGAEVNVQADWSQTADGADDFIKNKPTIPAAADGSETKVTAGTNVTVTGAGTTASPYVVNSTAGGSTGSTLAIGDSYQGGIIFWLDATGQHGLIAATEDQSKGIQWYNGTYKYTGSTGDGLYAGAMNTAMIVATQMADNQTGNFAAKVCADYSVTVNGVTYGDWYLPSKYELNLLYLQKNAVGGFGNDYYWSSSESANGGAWEQYFGNGGQDVGYKDAAVYVRAVRAF